MPRVTSNHQKTGGKTFFNAVTRWYEAEKCILITLYNHNGQQFIANTRIGAYTTRNDIIVEVQRHYESALLIYYKNEEPNKSTLHKVFDVMRFAFTTLECLQEERKRENKRKENSWDNWTMKLSQILTNDSLLIWHHMHILIRQGPLL